MGDMAIIKCSCCNQQQQQESDLWVGLCVECWERKCAGSWWELRTLMILDYQDRIEMVERGESTQAWIDMHVKAGHSLWQKDSEWWALDFVPDAEFIRDFGLVPFEEAS